MIAYLAAEPETERLIQADKLEKPEPFRGGARLGEDFPQVGHASSHPYAMNRPPSTVRTWPWM